MKKKLLLFVLLFLLIPCITVKADKEVCTYYSDTLTIDVTINKEKAKVTKLKVKGCIPDGNYLSTVDHSHSCSGGSGAKEINFVDGNASNLENWNSKYGSINFKAKEYYQENSECLPYAYLIDEIGVDVILSDESHKNEYIRYAETKQGYVELKLYEESVNKYNKSTCQYKDSNGNLSASYTITGGVASKVLLYGCMNNTKDSSHSCSEGKVVINEKESIQNWSKTYEEVPLIGKNYYYNNVASSNSGCSPYAYLIDTKVGLHFVLSDANSQTNIEEYAKDKQGYTKLSLTDNSKENVSDAELVTNSCVELKNSEDCTNDNYFSCIWVETDSGGYCNVDDLQYVTCGGAFDIPSQVPSIMSFIINFFKVVVPILLIIMSIISLVKALAASKDDEIKKAQSTLVRRLVACVMAFLVISITQFVILKVADDSEADDVSACLSCLLNNDCDTNTYFKTSVDDEYVCHLVSNPNEEIDCPQYDYEN